MVIGSSIATDLNFASLSPGQNINRAAEAVAVRVSVDILPRR